MFESPKKPVTERIGDPSATRTPAVVIFEEMVDRGYLGQLPFHSRTSQFLFGA